MPWSLDRRRFLGGMAAAGSLTALAASASAASEDETDSQPTDADSTQPVRIAVMGLSRGQDLALGFAALPNVHVTHVCDVDRSRIKSCSRSLQQRGYPRPEGETDFRRLLEQGAVDALACAAPNHWHAPATILACQANIHVYVEKPCSHNPQEGEWMVEAARQTGRVVQMGAQRRSSVGTVKAMQRLAEGAIGRPYLARCWYSNARGSIGTGHPAPVPENLNYDLWQGPAPRRPYVDNLVHYNWHWRWHWGNGELGNNGVHALDLCRWGMQVDYPAFVTSSGGRYAFKDDQQTPDTHTVAYEFPGEKQITWQGLSCNRYEDRWVMFHGDQGTLDLKADGRFVIYDRQNKEVERFERSDGGQSHHLQNFVTAVRASDPSLLHCEIEEGHKTTLLCHLGNIAHRMRRSLVCRPQDGHVVGDDEAMKLWRRQYEPGWEPQV